MSLDDFIITCFCLIDEMLPQVTGGKRVRQHGPQPKLSDSEVITMEVVGLYLGLGQDQALYDYFRRHYTHFFSSDWPCPSHDLCAASHQPVGHQRTLVVLVARRSGQLRSHDVDCG